MPDVALIKTPLYILKKLQRNTLKRRGGFLRGRVLDIGCGESPYRDLFPQVEYIGMDNEWHRRADLIGDAASLPFKDESVDGIILTEVIEHVQKPQEVMLGIARILREDGLLYVTAPMTWCLHYEPRDYYRFTRYGLEHLVRKSGLVPLEIIRIGGICSLIAVRTADVLFEFIQRLLFFLRPRWRERVGLLVLLPYSLVFYAISLLGDRVDRRDALGWAALARKTGKGHPVVNGAEEKEG